MYQPCLQYHVDKALEAGASDSEIAQAIEIAKMVRKGAAAKMDKFASGMSRTSTAADVPGEGCGCG